MNARMLRPAPVIAATVAIGGLFLVMVPQHGARVVQLMAVTIAVGIGLHALLVNVAGWRSSRKGMSPFDWRTRPGRKWRAPEEITRIRWALSDRRQPVEGGPPLTPEALRMLQPLIRVALEREGVDPDDGEQLDVARRFLSPLTWAVLTSAPLERQDRHSTLRPDSPQVAEVVHDVLDDLDRLETGRHDGNRTSTPATPRPR